MGSWLNMLGAVLRVIGMLNCIPEWAMFPVVMGGQTLCAFAQPLVIFAPTKLAALWFPDRQRATANMMASMGNLFYISYLIWYFNAFSLTNCRMVIFFSFVFQQILLGCS